MTSPTRTIDPGNGTSSTARGGASNADGKMSFAYNRCARDEGDIDK